MPYRTLDPLARMTRFHLLERERIFRLMEGGLNQSYEFDIVEGVIRDTLTSGPKDLTRHLGDDQLEKDYAAVSQGALKNPLTGGWQAAANQIAGDTPESRAHDKRAAADPAGVAVDDLKAPLDDAYFKPGYVDPKDKAEIAKAGETQGDPRSSAPAADVRSMEGIRTRRGTAPPQAQEDPEAPPARTPLKTPTPEPKASMGLPIATRQAGGGGIFDSIRDNKSDSTFKRFGKAAGRLALEPGLIVKDMMMGGNADSLLGGALGWNKETSWLDRAQDVVDVIGVFDPTGIADAANALGYAARGKWGAAAVSALGIIPYAGDVGKLGKWAARAMKGVGKTAKAAPRIVDAAQIVEKGAAKMAEKRAAKAAGKAVVQGGEATAKAGGRFGKVKQAVQKGKDAYKKAEPYIKRGREAQEKIQGRRDAEAQRAGEAPKSNALSRLRGAAGAASGTVGAGQAAYGQGREAYGNASGAVGQAKKAYQAAKAGDIGGAFNAAKGAVSQGREAYGQGRAAVSKGRAAVSKGHAAFSQASGGGGGKKATEIPVAAKCTGSDNKTSTDGATPGYKRCNRQTPGRDHGDD